MSSFLHWFALSFVILSVVAIISFAWFVAHVTTEEPGWRPEGSHDTDLWPPL